MLRNNNSMRSFTEYWNEKAAKRKKSWAIRAKRFAERHMQLDDIRNEVVYSRMDRKELRDFLDGHQSIWNPIARWDSNMRFSFSEQGLREGMQALGADISALKMTVSKKSIVGQQPHDIAYGSILDLANNRRDLYEKYTDLETCTINYKEVTMVIYRYTYQQQPFALYELVPCKQLSFADLRLEETSFSTLDVAKLLLEIAAEFELRNEELNYHAKKLKLRTMEAATLDSIEFDLWDEKKLEKKIPEYIATDYNIDKIIEQVCRPWKKAIEKYFHAAVERSLKDKVETIGSYSCRCSSSKRFVDDIFRPYLEKSGLREVEIEFPERPKTTDVILKYQGAQSRLSSDYEGIYFYPNAYYDGCFLDLLGKSPLSAVADYLKMMPALNQKMDETILQVLHIYDQQMQQKEAYLTVVEHLEALAKQFAGKPVGKMMKYLRWEAGRLINSGYLKLLIPTIKVVSDNSFSYLAEKRKYFNGQITQEEVVLWVDTDCHIVYASDPSAPDPEGKRLPSRTVQEFVRFCDSSDPEPILAIDFIEQKL